MLSPLQSFSTEQRPCIWRPYAVVSLILLIAFLAWDSTAWDMHLATLWGEPRGFALRDNWWMTKIMHDGARNLGWVFLSTLLIGIWRPWGSLKALATADRVGLFLSVLSALLPVTLIKGFSQTNCPWDLQAFGGLAPYVSHWNLWFGDGSGGHCFPAGHASTGFAFMAAYFGLLKQCPWRHAVAGIGNRRRIYFGVLTANARRALHEPHPLDGMVVLDCRLDEPCSFSPHWTKSKKLVLIRLLKF